MANTMTSTPYATNGVAAPHGSRPSLASKSRVRYDAAKGLSLMLLAAMASAMVVVADQLIDTWADGHLLAAWVALWAVGFAALAVFSGAARQLAVTAVDAFNAWSRRVAQTRADERFWAIAQTDPRVMADLRMVIQRNEEEAATMTGQSSVEPLDQDPAATVAGRQRSRAARYGYLPYI
jgi:hypothetical protein